MRRATVNCDGGSGDGAAGRDWYLKQACPLDVVYLFRLPCIVSICDYRAVWIPCDILIFSTFYFVAFLVSS